MIEPVYVPYEQYRAAKTRCGLDSRIYDIYIYIYIYIYCFLEFIHETNNLPIDPTKSLLSLPDEAMQSRK
jgi:hypothetical protein